MALADLIYEQTKKLPDHLAREVLDFVGYASTSEVIREALRDWTLKRELRLREVAALKAEIDRGMADVAEGRASDFDAERIIEKGKTLLAG